MLLLPPLAGSQAECRLALDDAAAGQLVACLLASDLDRATQLFVLLSGNPPLALWTVCQAAHAGAELSSATGAAAWLAPRLSCMLQGISHRSDDAAADRRLREGELLATSLRVAKLAGDLARHDGEAAADDAYFAGLLHAAPVWISLTSSAAEISPADVLPGWVRQLPELLEVDGRPPAAGPSSSAQTGGAMARVRQALERLAGEPRMSEQVSATPAMPDEKLAEAVPVLLNVLVRAEQLEQSFERDLQTAKLTALKEFAYGAGHEINNPLANISARAQTLLKDECNPERRRKLAAINTQAFRAHEMIADMMLFARPPKLVRSKVDLTRLVDRVIGDLIGDAEQRATTLVRVGVDWPLEIEADPAQLKMALRAVVINALEAIGQGGRIEIEVSVVTGGDLSIASDACAQIAVTDTGPGIPPAVLPHIFDPFYSGREAGRGLGFGLSKSWQIVHSHGGRIEAESKPRHGAVFRMTLPISGPADG